MKYKWNSRKQNRVQHICNDVGLTYCKAENGSWRFDTLSDKLHPSRPVCNICKHMVRTAQHPTGRILKPGKKRNSYRDPFLHTWEWKQVRYMVLMRSDGKCGCCGRGKDQGAVLNVDHIKPRRRHPELALTLSNLQVLCSECNRGKGNWDQTDWRETASADHAAMDAEFSAIVQG